MAWANNVNFPGTTVAPSTLDAVSPAHYAALAPIIKEKGGRLASYFGLRLYDTARIAAGTAMSSADVTLFQVPKGNTTTEWNGTTQYQKNLFDTNMTVAGQLPQGFELWVTSIQARVTLTGELDDSTQTGANLGLANAPGTYGSAVAADAVIASNLTQAILESTTLTFTYNNTSFESGPLFFFPSKYGVSGFGSNLMYVPAAAGTQIAVNDQMVNNGFGDSYALPIIRHIQPLYNFGVTLSCSNPFVPTRNFRIQVILEGLGVRPVTG